MDIDAEWNALLDIVEHGSRFEALRAARQLKELAPKRRLEREQENEKQKAAATK